MPHLRLLVAKVRRKNLASYARGMAARTKSTERKRRKRGTGAIVPRRNGVEAAIQFDGKRQSRLFATHDEAERWLDELVAARNAEARPQESNELSYWIDQWLATKSGTKRETRQKATSETVLLDTVMGHLSVMDITAEHINTMWQLLSPADPRPGIPDRIPEPGKPPTDSEWEAICRRAKALDLKPASEGRPGRKLGTPDKLNRTYRHLVNALELAKANGVVASNVADNERVKPGKRRAHEAIHAWTPQEVRNLLQTATGHRYYPLFYIALSTGIRIGEAQALRWRNINQELTEMTILETGEGTSAQDDAHTAKTDASYRIVPIDSQSREWLLHLRAQRTRNLRSKGTLYNDRDLVFAGPSGGPLPPKRVNKALKNWCASSGAQRLTFHSTRHTYVSMARRAGIKIEIISKRLGHASAEYTQRIYRHIYPDEGTNEVLSIDQMLERGSTSFRRPDASVGPLIDAAELTDRLMEVMIDELEKRDVDLASASPALDAAMAAAARTVSWLMQDASPSQSGPPDMIVSSNRDCAWEHSDTGTTGNADSNSRREDSKLKRVA